jgi:hypothetical protein
MAADAATVRLTIENAREIVSHRLRVLVVVREKDFPEVAVVDDYAGTMEVSKQPSLRFERADRRDFGRSHPCAIRKSNQSAHASRPRCEFIFFW